MAFPRRLYSICSCPLNLCGNPQGSHVCSHHKFIEQEQLQEKLHKIIEEIRAMTLIIGELEESIKEQQKITLGKYDRVDEVHVEVFEQERILNELDLAVEQQKLKVRELKLVKAKFELKAEKERKKTINMETQMKDQIMVIEALLCEKKKIEDTIIAKSDAASSVSGKNKKEFRDNTRANV